MKRQASAVVTDLAASDLEDFVDRLWRDGPVDVWVNNAGADVLTGDAAQLSFDEKLARLWAVDVRATIALSRAVGRRMSERGRGVDPQHRVGPGGRRHGRATAARCSPR